MELKSDVSQLKTGLESDITHLKTGFKINVTQLEKENTELKSDITKLKADKTRLEDNIAGMKKVIDNINDTLHSLPTLEGLYFVFLSLYIFFEIKSGRSVSRVHARHG